VDYPIRPITPEEAVRFFHSNAIGFGHDPRPEEGIASTLKYADLARSISVWDGDQVCGTAGTWTFEMTVPGGFVPCGGLTWVSVLPSHRRQGILTAMMRYQLEQVRDCGEAIAALWASESVIYSRFGYGMAAEGVEMKIDRTRTALRHAPKFSGRTRYIERDEALATWPAIWDEVRRVYPGMHNRTQGWWENRVLRQPAWPPPPGYSSLFNVQYEEGGKALGFARYRIKEDYTDGNANGTLNVNSLFATTDAAYSALWQHIFGVDLVGTITAEWRQVDEPLYAMLADPRRLVRRTSDSLWVRMVDIPRALAARRYATSGELVIEIRDEFCPWNAGRYVLDGGPDGANCSITTTRQPALTMTANELGALYLGGMRAHTLARAGRIEGADEAVARADAMFAWNPQPWAPEIW
jgi:predicted acetyltransferase